MLFCFGKRRRISSQNIAAIVFDFDGVFTDNKVIVTEDGKEAVTCNRADGLGIEMLRAKKIPLLIISTEANPVVRMRARKLGLDNVWSGIADKKDALTAYCAHNGIHLHQILYVGNDINDYEVMKNVGYPVAPRDAHPKIRRVAKYILTKRGGEGVVQELAENLII